MNQENCRIVQEAVKDAGDYLKGKLPDLPNHPDRNPYAHLWRSIKHKMGVTYKDCQDADLQTILDVVAWHKKHCV